MGLKPGHTIGVAKDKLKEKCDEMRKLSSELKAMNAELKAMNEDTRKHERGGLAERIKETEAAMDSIFVGERQRHQAVGNAIHVTVLQVLMYPLRELMLRA